MALRAALQDENDPETKLILERRCTLHVLSDGAGEKLSDAWVADDLGITMSESQVLNGAEEVTLRVIALSIGEPDEKLFAIPQG